MLKKLLNYFRKNKIKKIVLERNINKGFIKILKIETYNEYDFVWIELLNYEVIRHYLGLPPYKDIEKADYPFEIIALKNGKFLEEEPQTRIALRYKEYNEDYLSLEKNKDKMFFLEVLYDKHLGQIQNLKEFKAQFDVFLIKNLTKRIENEKRNLKAYFVKLDKKFTDYALNRVFVYDMDNNKLIKQIYLTKPEEDLLSKNIKNIINDAVNDYLEKNKTKEDSNNFSLEDWNGEL